MCVCVFVDWVGFGFGFGYSFIHVFRNVRTYYPTITLM